MELKKTLETYYDKLPQNMCKNATISFFTSAAIYRTGGCDNKTSLAGGACAAMTSVIEALTRPIIRSIFPNHPTLGKWIQLLTPQSVISESVITPLLGLEVPPGMMRIQALLEPILARNIPTAAMRAGISTGLSLLKFGTFNYNWYEKNIARVSW